MKWFQRTKEPLPVHPVAVEEALTTALGAARGILYKHSPLCASSMMAMRHIQKFADANPEVPVYMIDVVASRTLSQVAATRLDVPHESPQAIAIVDGPVVWAGSHGEVTAEALSVAMGTA